MTEQEAIKYIKAMTPLLMSCGSRCLIEMAEAQDMAIKALAKQQNNGWIPVSERLPSEEEFAKAYVRNLYKAEFLVMIEGANFPTTLYRSMDGFWLDENNNIYTVVAWMSMPEPYKGDDNNE